MLRDFLSKRRGFSISSVLTLVIACTTVMPLACEPEDGAGQGRLRNGGKTNKPGGNSDDPSGGDGDPSGPYDPSTPTNQGPTHNPDGFNAALPILTTHCSECHHARTWLDLESGADAETAAKIVSTLEKGTMPPSPRARLSDGELAAVKAWRDGETTTGAPASIDDQPSAVAVTQVLAANTLATYKAALPAKVGWKRLEKIFASPSTLFWDKVAIPPAYQDTVGDGGSLPFGARFNNSGRSLIVPEGKKLFSDDGKTWSFPFGHTAGTDESTNAFIVNFMSLPATPDKQGVLPIAYTIESTTTQGFPIKRWNWSFPKGTIVGEIIMIKDASGKLVTSEIRTRERFVDRWATNSFRPFPTAKMLAAAIKEKKPSWQGTAPLSKLVGALEDQSTLTPERLDSPAFGNMVVLEGAADAPLPDLDDDALARDLLSTTPFVASYGTSWKESGATRSFGITGPASAAKLSIVPNLFTAGALEVRETTCEKCHNEGGTFIGSLVDQAVLYGDIWGVDRIFSFHPFEPSKIDASGNENRSVRAAFASIVVPYSAAKHPNTTYTFYRPK